MNEADKTDETVIDAEFVDMEPCPIAEAMDEVADTIHDVDGPKDMENIVREASKRYRDGERKGNRIMKGVDRVLDKLAPMFKEPRPVFPRYSK